MIYTFDNLKEIPIGSYGVIGNPVEHSMSPALHSFFAPHKSYVKILLKKEELKAAIPQLAQIMNGYNVTIPFKEDILPFLDEIDDTAKLLKAVNTVKIEDGKLKGYNTDLFGFLTSVKASGVRFEGKKVLLLGAGGVAKTIGYAALQLKSQLFVSSRTHEKTVSLCSALTEISGSDVIPLKSADEVNPDIILNATPSGMWKKTGFSPIILKESPEFVYDSIYNPIRTKLLLSAKQTSSKIMNGSLMLSAQAAKAREIWDGKELSEKEIFEASLLVDRETKKMFPINIVLTGFMGSGKTTISKKLARLSGLPLSDLDSIIEQKEQKKISEIFLEGEAIFRQIESKCLEELLSESHGILSLGGGTVCFSDNINLLKNSPSFLFYLKTDFDVIMQRVGKSKNRPLMKKTKAEIETLFKKREKHYLAAADFVIDGNRTPGEVSHEIYQFIKELI